MPDRTADISRQTKETQIKLSINLDGHGDTIVNTGVGFFDHMLDLLGRHGLIDLNVQVYPHISIARGAELCRQNGFTVLQEGNQNGYLELRLPIENIDALSSMPFIRYLELVPPPGEPEDTRGRSLHRANLVDSDHAFGKHYNGDGVRVMVRDDGIVGPHADFKGRLDNRADLNDVANHADWVSGAMAGAGNIDPRAKGMAPGAKVYVVDYNPSFQDQTLNLHLDENVTITNTSYSNNCNAGYTLFSQTVDDQMFEHPTLTHVFSAGNMGTANCQYGAGSGWGNITGGHKMAKNAFLVANLIADGTLSNSSSRGPARWRSATCADTAVSRRPRALPRKSNDTGA